MSLSLKFLVQLKILCEKELSKRGQDHHEAGSRDVLSVRRRGNTSGSSKTHRALNRAEKPVKPNCISNSPKENFKEVSEEGNSNSEAKIYSCAKCDFSTGSHSDYINHTVFCVNTQNIRCSLCSQNCKAAELEDHLKSVHLTPDFYRRGEDGSYICIKCNTSCKHFSKFKQHLYTLVHRDLDMCRPCKVILPLKEMTVHQEEFHSKKGGAYICKICDKQLSNKICLDRHMNSVHAGDQRVSCELCGATFKRKDTLKRHIENHSNVRCYPCPLCKLSFKLKVTLDEHVKNIHSKNRYQCEQCYRGFSDKSDFDNHVLTHQGFVFRCMVCGKGFKTYRRREDHFKYHLTAQKQTRTKEGVTNHGSHLNGIPDSEEDMPAITLPRKKKANVRRNSKKKSVKLDEEKKSGSCKNPVSEVHSANADKKCYSDFNVEKDSNLETCQLGKSELLDSEKFCTVDKSLPGETTSKTVMLVGDLVKNDSYGFSAVGSEHAIAGPVALGTIKESEEFCVCSTDYSKSEEEVSLTGSSCFLHPSSTIPEKTLFVDLNTVPGIDSDVESFSSFRPDSSVTGSTLVIDVDNVHEVENIEVIDLVDVDSYPIELQYYEVQTGSWKAFDALREMKFETDSVVSACSTGTDDFLGHHIKGETDSGVSLCNDASQDGPPVKKASAKRKLPKISRPRKSRRCSKSSKYPLPEKKVVMRNMCTDDDDFALPEFVIEEEE